MLSKPILDPMVSFAIVPYNFRIVIDEEDSQFPGWISFHSNSVFHLLSSEQAPAVRKNKEHLGNCCSTLETVVHIGKMLKWVHLSSNFFSVELQNSTLVSFPLSFWFLTDEINLLNDLSSVQKNYLCDQMGHKGRKDDSMGGPGGTWNTISFR